MYTTKISHMNLSQIANSGQCFRWQQINDNTYKIPAFGKEITISQRKTLTEILYLMKKHNIAFEDNHHTL